MGKSFAEEYHKFINFSLYLSQDFLLLPITTVSKCLPHKINSKTSGGLHGFSGTAPFIGSELLGVGFCGEWAGKRLRNKRVFEICYLWYGGFLKDRGFNCFPAIVSVNIP